MQIIAETHSHTVACDHAFSTLYELSLIHI